MLLDILTALPGSELLERTSSTLRVQQVVQLSLAPAFLLAGIGAVMNVMTNRLIWVANKIERIIDAGEDGDVAALRRELPALEQRRIYAQRAVMFSTASALAISIVIVLLFVSAFVETALGSLVSAVWVICMGLLVIGLGSFWMETRTAARRNRERMRERREAAMP
ncbi:MAG: GTP-binding protein [Actinobacteria bacterium]|nr:GTP-binding protein [Actinomycetota bacterium]